VTDTTEEAVEETSAEIIELRPDFDFMAVRRRLTKCNNPIEIEEELRKLKAETGLTLTVLKQCAKELEREKRDRQQEIRRQTQEKLDEKKRPSEPVPEWANTLLYNKEGEIKDCPYNIVTILKNHPEWKGKIRNNNLSGYTEIDGNPITESQIFEALEWCGKVMRMAIRSVNSVYQALRKAGADDSFNPVTDMYDALPAWDGTKRVDFFLSDFLGAKQEEYTAYVGRMLLCSMVARAYEPGCIMRRMPVLEGPENAGKSLFVHDLGHPWSAEISSNMESAKQFQEDIRGIFVAELMEMDALRKAASSRVKSVISQRVYRYRAPWGHVSEGHKNTTVFVGTVNPNKALNLFDWDDENTRFFPLVMKFYNSDAFLAAKPQLFAEAKAILTASPANWWVESDAVQVKAAALRAGRSAIDPWFDPIAEFLLSQHHLEVTIPTLLFDCLRIPLERQTHYEATRVGRILHSLHWVISGTTRQDGQSRTRIYRLGTPE